MAEVRQIICDIEQCRALKKAENHWWMVWIDGEGELHLRPLRGTPGAGVLTFCGEPCAMKKISAYMSGAKGQRTDPTGFAWSVIGPTEVLNLLPEGQRRA